MPQYQRYQQDDDEDYDQPDQQDQQQNDEDDDNNDNDSQRDQTQQQQQGDNDDDNDDDDNKSANTRGGEAHDDDDDDNDNADGRGQPQDDDDDEQREKASQQQDEDEDENDSDKGRTEAQDNHEDDSDEGRTKAQDNDDDDDEQKASQSLNVNINFNIELGENRENLENSELHEGGIIFSKKLLAQLFSGPGEDDPDEKEIPVHHIQHEHMETADSGEWTIVELKTQNAEGATIYLKAKLDSGADDNFMSFNIYEATGLGLTPYEGPSFTMGDGQQSQPLGTVRLEYTADKTPEKFIETFQVSEGLPHDVIIDKPLMTAAHMMMVNPNYANPPSHPALCLMLLGPKNKASRAKAEAFQKQRAAEQAAEHRAKLEAQGALE